jgi:hypothetical protein
MGDMQPGTKFVDDGVVFEVVEWDDENRGWVCEPVEPNDETESLCVSEEYIEARVLPLDPVALGVAQTMLNHFHSSHESDALPTVFETLWVEQNDPDSSYDRGLMAIAVEMYEAGTGETDPKMVADAGLNGISRLVDEVEEIHMAAYKTANE